MGSKQCCKKIREWRCFCCGQYQNFKHKVVKDIWIENGVYLCCKIEWQHHIINNGSKTCNIWKNTHCLKLLELKGMNGLLGQRWKGIQKHDRRSWAYSTKNVKHKDPYDVNSNVMLLPFFIHSSKFNMWHYEDFLVKF
jgi:hypothetical protein